MAVYNQIVLDSQDIGTTGFVSNPIDVRSMFLGEIQIVVSGTLPAGTFTLESSADDGSARTPIATWVVEPSSSQAITDVGTLLYRLVNICPKWLRVRYVRTSGSGSVTITAHLKNNVLKA